MVTETATRKRVYSLQCERNPSWMNASFPPRTPFGLANGSEITPSFEKRLRTVKKSMSTFKWEPDLPGNLQFSVGYGFKNVEVKTPLPAAWQDRPSRGLSTPPYVRTSRLRYEGVKEELRQRPSWFSKLDRSTALAEDALDRVGRPVIGLNLTLGPSESYYQKYVHAKRELEDYKRVVNAVNSYVPLASRELEDYRRVVNAVNSYVSTSNGSHAEFLSLESMRRRGSNLQQGPRNLYNIQEAILRESQTGGGHSNSRMANGDAFRRTEYDETQRHSELEATDAATGSGPKSSVQPAGASVASHDHAEGHVPKQDNEQNEDWRILWKKAQSSTPRMESRARDIEALSEKWSRLQINREEDEVRRQKVREASKEEEVIEALLPLSAEAEHAVGEALYDGNRDDVLAFHEETNIEVTRAIMQCLVPGAWLNDEVINVYMQLLKERENRSPDKFLKCHFFNTFFYNKLFKDKRSYDYKSVRRWTTQRKIGYSLADCDKILVPIHQDIHWCLAVINLRDQKFEYLDSLSGRDENVLRVLARYLVDEVKDKNSRILDVSKWESFFPQDIPEQLNGCDCGMFMLKYADFHSRGESLSFTQAHMEYFRKRTVYEILRVEAS